MTPTPGAPGVVCPCAGATAKNATATAAAAMATAAHTREYPDDTPIAPNRARLVAGRNPQACRIPRAAPRRGLRLSPSEHAASNSTRLADGMQ